MSTEIDKYLKLKKEIANDVSERCVPEFQKVVDYAKREVSDMIIKVEESHQKFTESYDARLDTIEENQTILEENLAILEKNHETLDAKLLPKWFLGAMVFAIILCLIVIIILVLNSKI